MTQARLEARGGDEVGVTGDLSFATVPSLWREADRLIDRAKGDLCFDLAGVGRTDSAGVALLIEWVRAATARGLSARFRNIPAQLLDIARVSGVEELLSTEKA